jgi:hypothetical protein
VNSETREIEFEHRDYLVISPGVIPGPFSRNEPGIDATAYAGTFVTGDCSGRTALASPGPSCSTPARPMSLLTEPRDSGSLSSSSFTSLCRPWFY